jgi:hypothetical protein
MPKFLITFVRNPHLPQGFDVNRVMMPPSGV